MTATNEMMAVGRVNFSTGEKITSDDLNLMGAIGIQSLYHLLAHLCTDTTTGEPRSGFVGDGCLVTVDGLEAEVAPGFGVFYDLTEDEDWVTSLRPLHTNGIAGIAINAHHATLARIDIITMAPGEDTGLPQSRNFKDPSTGALSTAETDKKAYLAGEATYTAGTAGASPTAPATPSGHVKLCELRVPATSGTILVDDFRPRFDFGQEFGKDPCGDYSTDFVPGSSTELQVTQSSTPAMTVRVAGGEAVIDGVRRRYGRQTLVVTAADATNPRIDIVVANDDGTLSVTAGTPAGSPSQPVPSASQLQIAQVAVAALAASIVNANITDSRVREPIGTAQIQDDAIEARHILDGEVTGTKILDGEISSAKLEAALLQTTTLSLTSAQIKALRATPITLIAAPGAGKVIEVISTVLLLDYGSNVFTRPNGDEDLALAYDGTTVFTADTAATFVTAATDCMDLVFPVGGVLALAKSLIENKAVKIKNIGTVGEIGGNASNDSVIRVKVSYRVWPTGW